MYWRIFSSLLILLQDIAWTGLRNAEAQSQVPAVITVQNVGRFILNIDILLPIGVTIGKVDQLLVPN